MKEAVCRLARACARTVLRSYRVVRIYETDLGLKHTAPPLDVDIRRLRDPDEMRLAKDPRIQDHAWFVDGDAVAFGLWVDGELVAICVNWTAPRFQDPAVASLAQDEVALVDLLTAAAHRGKGYGGKLLAFAEDALKRHRFRRAVCTVWHSNEPSIRTFERAGWTYTAFLIEATVRLIDTPLRLRLARRVRG